MPHSTRRRGHGLFAFRALWARSADAPMRALFALIVFLAVVANGATRTPSDADISKALIGTWVDGTAEREPMHGRVTYFADGHSVEFVWPAGQTESSAVRIETLWSVTK